MCLHFDQIRTCAHGTVPSGSAVARGGAGGTRAPPVFFLESKNRPVQNVKNKILSSNCLGSFQKTTCR